MTDPRASTPKWVCSGNAVVVTKRRKQENIWALLARFSESVSVVLVLYLAQFERNSKGM